MGKKWLLVSLLALWANGAYAAEPGQAGLVLEDFEYPQVTSTDGKSVATPAGKLVAVAYVGPASQANLAVKSVEAPAGHYALELTWSRGDWAGVSLGPFDDGKGFGQWGQYAGIALWVEGTGSGATLAVDIRDSQDEVFRAVFRDNFTGWKRVFLPFKSFQRRTDWQPTTAKVNGRLDWPARAYTLEPLSPQGRLAVDLIELATG